ncbi:MAG: hypothetical protein L6R37_006019 [Teloschistes peruensis]|nr:MAG: hypothetical protein L6R37_006019 [Teloschistes peruensis]
MSKVAEVVQEPDEEKGETPDILFDVEEDLNRKDQLFSFRKEQSIPTKDYRAKEQQLLQEGKMGNSEFSARLRKVSFGVLDGQSACLIVFRVDFATVKKGWFRFRNATIEAEFEESSNNELDQTDHNDEDEDEEEYNGPMVRKFYPDLIRGHIASAAQTYGLGFEIPLSPVGGAAISAKYDITAPREGLHLIQGRLMGSPETRIKWIMNENEANKGGIYEQPTFAVIVGHAHDQPFTMSLKIKATTYGMVASKQFALLRNSNSNKETSTGGLPVTGKGGSRILFKPSKANRPLEKQTAKPNARLTGGSYEIGKQQWTSSRETPDAPEDLSMVDLESLTQMKADLLSKQGPGAGPSIWSSLYDS